MSAPLVSIVGAGPGSPDLLTWLAVRRLRRADVVYYDGLVPRAIAELARRARLVQVSRRAGERTIPPADVAAAMVRDASAGRRVVRLRAGDPFVLARGAEEAFALTAAGVPFDVVPGLTSASAAPTLAGIPLTHRGVSSGFVVVSGHARDAYAPVLAGLPKQSTTIVVLMGLAERRAIGELLIDTGWRPETPAAVIVNASRATQRSWFGTLHALGKDDIDFPARDAGVIVIGDVVEVGLSLAAAMRPLRLRRTSSARRGAIKGTRSESEDTSWPQ